MEEIVQEIEALKKEQEERRVKSVTEITKLKKEKDRLVVEKAHLFASRVQLKVSVTNACQYVLESTTELVVVARAQ